LRTRGFQLGCGVKHSGPMRPLELASPLRSAFNAFNELGEEL
jgi:hypothetical protein